MAEKITDETNERNTLSNGIAQLHKMINAVDSRLQELGIIKELPPEEYTVNLACLLFLTLAESGLWNEVSPEEIAEEIKHILETERVSL